MTAVHTGARRLACRLAIAMLAPAAAGMAHAETVTACTVDDFCYCVDPGLRDTIDRRIVYIRNLVAAQRAQGKSTGYMSIPLSTVGGGYYGVNVKVAAEVKQHVEDRLGRAAAWLLNPGAPDIALPSTASNADYMLMWTNVLAGRSGLGEDFDFVYFVGPSAFARHFGLDGHGDMEKIDAYYDALAKTDPGVLTVDKKRFREYYALRAAVSFSFGSHDEWNIVRAINERRRNSKDYGLSKQLPVWFDGQAVAPGLYETPIAAGTAGACRKE